MTRCPRCSNPMPEAQVRCAACGAEFEPEALETLRHMEYVLWWLGEQGEALPGTQLGRLRKRAERERDVLRKTLKLDVAETAKPPVAPVAAPVAPAVQPAVQTAPRVTPAAPPVAPAGPAPRVAPPQPVPAAEWARRKAEEKAATKATKPPRPPRPAPKPREPLVNWGKLRTQIGDAAASGALLHALLYLGAFMIVVSLAILVARFWERFPSWAQVIFIFSVPTAFYAAGFFLHGRGGLKQAGSVLVGIGALLVAVDFAAIYQFGHLAGQIDAAVYWLITSGICTALYVLTAWRLPVAFMGYTVGFGAASLFAAVAAVLRLPQPWWALSAGLSAIPVMGAANLLNRKPERWAGLARAGFIWSALVLLAAQCGSLILPGRAPWAPVATFALAALGYAWLGFRLNTAFLFHGAVWSAAGAAFLGLSVFQVRPTWYAVAAAGLAFAFLVAATWAGRRWNEATATPLRRQAVLALRVAAGCLLGVAIVGGLATLFAETWAGIAALSAASFTLAAWSVLERRPRILVAACGLFVLPVLGAAWVLMRDAGMAPQAWQRAHWLTAIAAALALLYLLLGAALRRREAYASGLHLSAHVLAPLAGLALAAIASGQLSLAWISSVGRADDLWPAFAAAATVTLGVIVLVYVTSAILHHTGAHPGLTHFATRLPGPTAENLFLWPALALIPLWVAVALSWLAPGLTAPWIGVAVGALGLAYVWSGQALGRTKPTYRIPPQALAYGLAAVAILVALPDTRALFAALLLAVGTLASLSVVRQRRAEAIAAGLLFIWPFQIGLTQAALTLQLQALAYALLGSLAYVPLGLAWLRRQEAGRTRRDVLAMLAIGYAMTVGAVIASLAGRFWLSWPDFPWLRVLTALVAGGLAIFSVFRFRRREFAWAGVLLLGVAFGEMLDAASVPVTYLPVAWTGLALAAVVAGYGVTATRLPAWLRLFGRPVNAGAAVAGIIGLALTAEDTMKAFSGLPMENYLPLILAQVVATLAVIAAALLHRSSPLLTLEPFLAFFPVTLFFIGAGERLVGRPLVPAEYALVWTGLALIHLIVAALVDRQPIRYARGLYLGGYLLLLFAVLWSASDRRVNLVVLGIAILVALASQVLDHLGLHMVFQEFIGFVWRKPDSLGRRMGQLAFLFFASFATPVWLVQLLFVTGVPMAWRGFALAALAAVYVALGVLLAKVRKDYQAPFFTAGYALTGLAVLVAANDEPMAIVVLAIDAAIYAVSTLIFRQPFWLYLANALVPVIVLLVLHTTDRFAAVWTAPALMVLAVLDLAGGLLVQRRRGTGGEIEPYALPFLGIGYLLSAIALAAGSGSRAIALPIYAAGAVIYALSAWLLRESLFLYPAAVAAVVSYYLGMTLTPLPKEWYGLGLLPLAVGLVALGRLAFDREREPARTRQERLAVLARPETPLYLVAFGVTIGMIVQSAAYPAPRTVVWCAVAAFYLGLALLFQGWLWLYPGLLAVHAALGSGLSLLESGGGIAEKARMAVPYHALTWALVACGLALSWKWLRGRENRGEPALTLITTPSWAQPFFLLAAIDVVVWQLVALYNLPVAVVLAAGNTLLLALLAILWEDRALPYAAAVTLLIGVTCGLVNSGTAWPWVAAGIAAAGLGLYLVGTGLDWAAGRGWAGGRTAIWPPALTRAGAGAGTAALIVAVAGGVTGEPLAAAGALAATGALYLAIAYRRRHFVLGYVALSMLLGAWLVTLIVQGVRQPQGYAIAAGLYMVVIGMLERRRGRQVFACTLETLGVTVPLTTSFLQSVTADAGLPYFVLLLLESVLVVWWSASRRVKVPFLVGIGFIVLNVGAQLAILATTNDVLRWVIIFGVGLLMVGSAILVERRRAILASRLRDWQSGMHAWQL